MSYEIRATQLTVSKEGEPTYDSSSFTITIEDESCGEYVILRSHTEMEGGGCVPITPEEWPTLREALDQIIGYCRDYK